MVNPTENLCACWLREDQAPLIREVAAQVGLEIVTAGGPGSAAIANELDAQPADDLRSMLASTRAGLVLIADVSDLDEGEDGEGLSAIVEAAERGVHILTFEPIPGSAMHLASPAWANASDVIRERISFVPLARRSSAFASASDLLEQFGAIDAVGVRALSNSMIGSLGARLFGTCEMLLTLMGIPESIDATHFSATGTPETLRDLSGHMTASVRYADGRCASMFLSDSAPAWSRSISVIGPGGLIDANDHRIRWVSPEGKVMDESQMTDAAEPDNIEPTLLADSIVTSLTPAFRRAPIDMHATLSMAQAAILSARTGHPESPATIRDMLSRTLT